MGGQSKEIKTGQSTTRPWEAANPALTGLLGQLTGQIGNVGLSGIETSALSGLQGNAAAGNPYASRIGGVASTLLGGGPDRTGLVSDAYSQYQQSLAPTARGDFVDPSSNPQLQSYLSTIQNDVAKRVNGMFAGAGRDFSGAHMGTLSRGIAEGTAPVLYNAYQNARGEQLGAIDKLYGAGGQTAGMLSTLDQTALGNRTAGIDASSAALQAQDSPFMQMLAVEAQRRGIPMQQLQQLVGMTVPIGSLGSQTNSTETKTTETPLINQLAGGLIGGAGLLGQFGAFGPGGWLYGNPTALLGSLAGKKVA